MKNSPKEIDSCDASVYACIFLSINKSWTHATRHMTNKCELSPRGQIYTERPPRPPFPNPPPPPPAPGPLPGQRVLQVACELLHHLVPHLERPQQEVLLVARLGRGDSAGGVRRGVRCRQAMGGSPASLAALPPPLPRLRASLNDRSEGSS